MSHFENRVSKESLDEEFDDPREPDWPLNFYWRTLDTDLIRSLGVSLDRNRHRCAAINFILTEAALAHIEGKWVSYSRRKQFYTGLRRYHGPAYTYAHITQSVQELVDLALLEEERSRSSDRGWQSRFRANHTLAAALSERPVACDKHEVIRLKSIDRKLVDYVDTDLTCRMRRQIKEINAALGSIHLELLGSDVVRTHHHIQVDGAYYRPTAPSLHRVFNRGDTSFRMGGRAYGWWQSLPKGHRAQMLINGQSVVEPDFVQMHASILYARRGLALKGDAYETGEFPRDLAKLAFNVALNASSRQGAISALLNKSDWPLDGTKTSKLLGALARRNAQIADDLHADQGIALMGIDSKITIRAVVDCIKAGIPALPVHDSMLTPRVHESRVSEIMEASAAQVLKGSSCCKVRCFSISVSQMLSRPVPPASSQLSLFPELAPFNFTSEMQSLRKRLGLSQRDLGQKIGCTQPHIANVERGRARLGDWPSWRLRELVRGAA